ncbi:hypothetical protein BsWGS_13272 [Bradybaena similaris]
MNALLKSLLLFVVLGVAASYWLADEDVDDVPLGYSDEDDANDLLAVFKRAASSRISNHCIPWRAPCTLDDALIQKYSFLRCCNSGACRCNLWGNNCRCEATLGR